MRKTKILKRLNRNRIGMKILVLCFVISILSMATSFRAYAGSSDDIISNSSDIIIDGYYDDWEDKPMSILTWNANNGKEHHDVSMIKDNEYIYIYVGMHPSYNNQMPTDAIYLSINNQECQLFIRYDNEKNTVDWGHVVDLSQNGIYLGLHPFTYYPNNSLGDAAITVLKGNPNDKMEIKINIKDLEKVMGLKEGIINNGSQIKLRMPNVGGGTIELLGTSTGAILGILLCVGVVISLKLLKNKKARIV